MWLVWWTSCALIIHHMKAHKEFTVDYFVPDVETSQADAKGICVASGYHLATILDAETMMLIEDFLSDSSKYTRLWIALEYEVSTGQFKWPNGEVATYTDWSGLPQEPDRMDAGEVCVRLELLSTSTSNYIDLVPSLNFVNTTKLDIIQVSSPIECAARCMELYQCDKMTYVNHQCSIYMSSYNTAPCSTMQLKTGL